MHESDPTVVAAARAGDRDAFRALVERHSRYIFALAHRMTGNAEDAEDVVQETWLKAHRQLSRFEARADFRTWLHRIAVNCSIDLIRARRHREDAHDPADLEEGPLSERGADAQPTPDRLAESAQIGDRVHAALARLTSLERAAFTLRHVEGMSIDEVGEKLGLKASATKHSVFRAVRKMRAALEPFAAERSRAGLCPPERHHTSPDQDELVLHYYGETAREDDARVEQHLADCAACRAEHETLRQVLTMVETAPPVDVRPGFERDVWARLEPHLDAPRGGWRAWFGMRQWALAGGLAAIVMAAFVAGRFSGRPRSTRAMPHRRSSRRSRQASAEPDRVLRAAVGDHLDRSQMMLVEMLNADPNEPAQFAADQARAEDLVAASRLYRQSAAQSGDAAVTEHPRGSRARAARDC